MHGSRVVRVGKLDDDVWGVGAGQFAHGGEFWKFTGGTRSGEAAPDGGAGKRGVELIAVFYIVILIELVLYFLRCL